MYIIYIYIYIERERLHIHIYIYIRCACGGRYSSQPGYLSSPSHSDCSHYHYILRLLRAADPTTPISNAPPVDPLAPLLSRRCHAAKNMGRESHVTRIHVLQAQQFGP